MSQGDDSGGRREPRHDTLNDNQSEIAINHQSNKSNYHPAPDNNTGGSDKIYNPARLSLPPILSGVTPDNSTSSGGSKNSRSRKNEQLSKRGSSRSRSRTRSRVSGTGSEEVGDASVHFPDIYGSGSRSPSSKRKRKGRRGRSRIGDEGEIIGEELPDSDQELSDYPDSDAEQEGDGKDREMNDKNQNIIRFVYSEAVRQALKNTYEFAHPLFSIPNSATAVNEEPEPKINFEILRLPEIYEDVSHVLTTASYSNANTPRRESKDKDGVSSDSHTSVTKRSLRQDSKGNMHKNKLGDIGKRQSGKSVGSDHSKPDRSNGKSKKKGGQAGKTVHFPSLNQGVTGQTSTKISA